MELQIYRPMSRSIQCAPLQHPPRLTIKKVVLHVYKQKTALLVMSDTVEQPFGILFHCTRQLT
jgi:hypothetical protein